VIVADVSVVIPAYNAARFLDRAVGSVAAQTRAPRELIIVDDGSQDDTEVVARSLAPHAHVLRQANGGPGAARNAGVRAATSECVCFLDADDEYEPDMIATLSDALAAFPAAAVASGAFYLDSVGVLTRVPGGRTLARLPTRGVVHDFFDAARHGKFVCTNAALVRRRAFDDVGGFREDIRFGEDVHLWCKLAGRHEWVFVNQPVSIYHHDASTSATLRAMYETWRTRELTTTVLLTEEQMRAHVRPHLWPSFRRYRRDWLTSTARGALQASATARARELLKQIAPAPFSLGWAATWLMIHAPAPLGEWVLTLNRLARAPRDRRQAPA
jgi:glycosyltransferase involved in cell wall biosynthesis